MARAIILVIDSFGIGASLDASEFGDTGADTFGHIVMHCQMNNTPLALPNLYQLGLAHAALASTGRRHANINYDLTPTGAYGYCVERSFGKDTPSGHWEMAGLPVMFEWGTFEKFPDALINTFIEQAKLPGILGNHHASGTDIIDKLGEEHLQTGKPIVYTSADSVFQIAAHEKHFGLERLYEICLIARKLVDPYNIGRVIARPFIGEHAGEFARTANRKDYATPPHDVTLLDVVEKHGGEVVAIGKISDIFAGRGITSSRKAANDMALFDETLAALHKAPDRSLIFTNFVDFDSRYGHRRNTQGYADALRAFDARLPELFDIIQKDDLVLISADHGCDPTMPGSDHTREHIPVLAFGAKRKAGFIGRRETFADIGQTVAKHLSLPALQYGIAF